MPNDLSTSASFSSLLVGLFLFVVSFFRRPNWSAQRSRKKKLSRHFSSAAADWPCASGGRGGGGQVEGGRGREGEETREEKRRGMEECSRVESRHDADRRLLGLARLCFARSLSPSVCFCCCCCCSTRTATTHLHSVFVATERAFHSPLPSASSPSAATSLVADRP